MSQGRTPVSMDLPIPAQLADRSGVMSKQEVSYAALKGAILAGTLSAGVRMPSTRTLAARWGLSRGTVEIVYDRLCSEGYFARLRGSGTFVSATAPDSYLNAQAVARAAKESDKNAATLESRPDFSAQNDAGVTVGKPFVARLPDPALFPLSGWSRYMVKAVSAARMEPPGSADPTGLPALRQQISAYLQKARNIDCSQDDILITTGTRHAIDLICRCFTLPGDKICVEDPCYPFALQIFALSRALIEHIPVTGEGICTATLNRHCDAKLVYVTPAHQSPLGITMSVSRRLELLEWSAKNNAIIIEDDYDSAFNYGGAPLPALMSIDGSDRVIYCGSFNKTVSSELRVGFIVAKGATRQKLSELWQILGRTTPLLEQVALEHYLRSGAFSRHLRVARQTYAQRRDLLLAILGTVAPGRFSVSGHEAGFHFLLWLAGGQDEPDFCRKAEAENLTLQPLSAFCRKISLPPAVIIGYTALNTQQIEEAGHKLASIDLVSSRRSLSIITEQVIPRTSSTGRR